MMITRTNYESYFIDLLDGNLSNKQVDVVLDFLRDNPDLEEELRSLENISLKPDTNQQFDFSALLKTDLDQPELFEEQCIRSIENELTDHENVAFQAYISKNQKAKNEYLLFKATVSEPDTLIKYQYKNKLFKTRRIPLYWLSAAAVIIFAMLFWFSSNNQDSDQVVIVARVEPLFEQTVSQINTELLKSKLLRVIEPAKKHSEIEEILVADRTITDQNEVISLLSTKTAFVTTESEPNLFALQLSPVDTHESVTGKPTLVFPTVVELLAEKVNEIEPKNELNKFAYLALNRLNSASNEKLDYTTNDDGKLNRVEYNSRFLAFSFPVKNK